MTARTRRRHPVSWGGATAEVGSAAELALALELVGPDGAREILGQLGARLPAIIGGPEGLLAVVRALAPADRSTLFAALGGGLAPLVRGARHLGELLALTADPEVEELLITTLGADALRSFAGSARHLADVLQWVYGECDHLVLELLGPAHLAGLLKNADDLAHALHALDPGGQEQLLEMLGPAHAADLVRNARDLARVLHALPRPAARSLLEGFTKAELVARIGGPEEWRGLCRRLPDDEARLLFDRLGVSRAS